MQSKMAKAFLKVPADSRVCVCLSQSTQMCDNPTVGWVGAGGSYQRGVERCQCMLMRFLQQEPSLEQIGRRKKQIFGLLSWIFSFKLQAYFVMRECHDSWNLSEVGLLLSHVEGKLCFILVYFTHWELAACLSTTLISCVLCTTVTICFTSLQWFTSL